MSYSQKDKKWKNWLLAKLESYHIPKALHGQQTSIGVIPKRIKPLFADRDELAPGVPLGPALESALSNSKSLIVLCSKESQKSPWVEAEIESFCKNRPRNRVLCIAVEDNSYKGNAEDLLPPSLTEISDQSSSLTNRIDIIADTRKSKDGKRDAFLKIVSGLLDIPFDHIKRRDDRRRIAKLWLATCASLLIAGITIFLALYANHQKNIAEKQKKETQIAYEESESSRKSAEALIEHIYSHLRKKLWELNRLDLLDDATAAILKYYSNNAASLIDLSQNNPGHLRLRTRLGSMLIGSANTLFKMSQYDKAHEYFKLTHEQITLSKKQFPTNKTITDSYQMSLGLLAQSYYDNDQKEQARDLARERVNFISNLCQQYPDNIEYKSDLLDARKFYIDYLLVDDQHLALESVKQMKIDGLAQFSKTKDSSYKLQLLQSLEWVAGRIQFQLRNTKLTYNLLSDMQHAVELLPANEIDEFTLLSFLVRYYSALGNSKINSDLQALTSKGIFFDVTTQEYTTIADNLQAALTSFNKIIQKHQIENEEILTTLIQAKIALTSIFLYRGDFSKVATFTHEACDLALKILNRNPQEMERYPLLMGVIAIKANLELSQGKVDDAIKTRSNILKHQNTLIDRNATTNIDWLKKMGYWYVPPENPNDISLWPLLISPVGQ